jgi:ferrous iron transport protein B
MSGTFIIGVVGNPNCGKTTLFNDLTGTKQRVGNWPGVTVERKTGDYSYRDTDFKLVDLPGTYSLDVAEENVSIDEQIARDYVASHEADLIINIVDASNLERNLYLTSELLEMRVPMLVALNMMDVAKERGYTINVEGLAVELGCPVVPIIAASGEGLPELQEAILKAAQEKHISDKGASYAEPIEQAITKLLPEIEAMASDNEADPRWLAVRMLENDSLAKHIAGDSMAGRLSAIQMETEQALGDDIDISLADARYGFVNRVTADNVQKKSQVKHSTSDKIDTVVLNRVLGIPIFLFMMYLMFMFTINIGGAFIDFFDIFTGTILVDGLAIWMGGLGLPEWSIMLLANGIGNGIQVVATFIPIIGFLFLFLSVLEDSGYMARAAFVMDRAMRAIGLPGKAFVSLIVGFGCNVPAVMATRTMEQERDRIMTIIMSPFMSCGARLPVYALFAAAFFPVGGQNIVFGLYIIGIAIAVLTGLVMKNTLLKGEATPFIMELPPYHLPTITGVLMHTWERTKGFIFNAGKIIIPMVMVLNLLNAIGTDGSYGNEDSNKSVLSAIGRTITPAFSPMGMSEDNWPAAVGIFTGILAKEAVVGTLDSLYSDLAKSDAEAAGITPEAVAEFDFWGGINTALATIPANLKDAMGSWVDPIGLEVGDISSVETAAMEQEVATGTFGAMVARFDGAAGAFAYLLLILLYFPCTAAIAAIYRETNLGWTMFVAGWTTGVAYIASTVFYQAAIFSRHPMVSLAWIAGMLTILICVLLILRNWGRGGPGVTPPGQLKQA